MPLVRYEVRCEHSLANPELYRSAGRDDPESLLEGVAMAGLVGIVRQLGDLAEFAAEIFCGLHDELMSLGSRGHDLNMRVQQLEDELPAIEKALLSEPNQLRFAYTNGADWHTSIRSDQNHCTSGDLPRFVRNYYEECRGPPQLFLLDKFDVSGVGACLKRYTDPSFFKLEWASTELMRAQREQRDKKARRDKKKGRRRRTGQPIAAINQIPARVRYGSASLEDLEGLPYDIASAFNIEVPGPSRLAPKPGSESQTQRSLPRGHKDILAEESFVPALIPIQLSAVSNPSEGVKYSKINVRDTGSANDSKSSEPEDSAGSLAGRISRIIDLEDRAAAPAPGYTKGLNSPANGQVQESKAASGVVQEDSGAAAMPHSVKKPVGTPRANARGEFSMEGDKPPSGNKAGSPTLLKSASRISLYMDALDAGRLSGKFLWKDGNEGGRFTRQISMARSGSEFDDFVDAPSRIGSEGDGAGSDVDSPGSVHRATHFNGDALNHAALKNHVEAQKAYVPSGMKLMEQQQSQPLSTPWKLADIAEREHDNGALPKGDLPAPLNEVPRASSASSGAQSNRSVEEANSSGEPLKAFPENGTDIQVPVADISKKDEEPDLVLTKVPSSLGSSSGASSPTTRDVLKPNVSMFSRHSSSSELISVSEPNSPTSPNSLSSTNSPACHALYSPQGSPPRESVKSPPLASYSPGAQSSSQSSPSPEEVPVLSESPTSFLLSSSPKPLAGSEPVSRQRLQLYPLPTPPMSPERENSSKSRGSSGSITERFGGSQNGNFRQDDSLPTLQLSPTSKHDIVSPSVLPISPLSGTPHHSVSSEFTRSSLERAVDSPPSSPHGSPKKSFQRVFLSSPSLSSSPLRNSSDDAPRCRSLGDEDSAPSSPSGSVIIKDSPPESPSYTGSECGSRDFDAIKGRPVRYAARETSGLKLESYADEVASVASLGSQSAGSRTSPEQGKSLLLSPVSHSEMALKTSAKFSLDSSTSSGSADHSKSQQRILPCVQSPSLRPEADPLPSTADHSVSQQRVSTSGQSSTLRPEVDPLPSTLKPISTARSTTKSYKSMTSNSPPDSPVASSNQWRGKVVPPGTPPRAAFRLPHQPPMRSPMRSPLLTPRSYFSETGTLKWLGRLDPGLSPKPNFTLPSNLVNHSETSSPACSPPPELDLDSPTKSTAASEDLDSPMTTIVHKGVEVEEYRLLDPPVSTSYVDAGGLSEEDYDDENIRQGEPQRVELSAASNSGPSHSSSSSGAGEFRMLTRGAEFEQLVVPKQPMTWASVVASDRAEQLGVSVSHGEALEPGLILRTRADDAEAQSTDSKHGSPSLFEESESSVELDHVPAQEARFHQGDVCDGAHAREKSLPTINLEPVDDAAPVDERAELEADAVSVAAERATPSPLENGEISLASFEPLNAAPSPLENGEISLASFEPLNAAPSPLEDGEMSLASFEPLNAAPSPSENGEMSGASFEPLNAAPSPLENGETSLASFEPLNAAPSPSENGEMSGASFEPLNAAPSPLENGEISLASFEPLNAAPSPLENGEISLASFEPLNAAPSPSENGEISLASFEPLNAADFGGAAPAKEQPPVFSLKETERGTDLEPVDVDGAEEQLPLSKVQETDMSSSPAAPEATVNFSATVHAAQSHEEVLPSLSTREPENSHEYIAEAAARVHIVESTSSSLFPPPPEFELRSTPTTKDALEAAIAQHDRNMLKVLTCQEPASTPPPPPDERSLFIDQMRTSSFNLRRNEGLESVPSIPRPVANINVAAILEKANAIRQAFAGSDDDDGEDDWSDS